MERFVKKYLLAICVTMFYAAMLGIAYASYGADSVNPQVIEGVWACVEATNGGQKIPDEKASQLRLTLTASGFKTQLGDQVLFDSTYVLDVSKTPVEIEMLGNEGDLKGKPALGIVKLESGTLTMCYVLPGGGERPKVFESQPGSKATLTVWKKADGK
jgi:uncharacterized protein (TIGR03067 family)